METTCTIASIENLDYLYSILQERISTLECAGYDVCTIGVEYCNNQTSLLFAIAKNIDKIMSGKFNDVIAIATGVGEYSFERDYVKLHTNLSSNNEIIVSIDTYNNSFSFDGKNAKKNIAVISDRFFLSLPTEIDDNIW